jgi:hypothetical protein
MVSGAPALSSALPNAMHLIERTEPVCVPQAVLYGIFAVEAHVMAYADNLSLALHVQAPTLN